MNTVGDFCSDSSSVCEKMLNFLNENMNWMFDQIERYSDDPYWHHVNLSLAQLQGLYSGFVENYEIPSTKSGLLELLRRKDQTFLNLL